MHPSDCPKKWEYTEHQNAALVPERAREFIASLRNGKIDTEQALHDTRSHHRRMFADTTPEKCPYYAGHYRGEKFRCLKFVPVFIHSDRRVGAKPEFVIPAIRHLSERIIGPGLAALQIGMGFPDAQLSPGDKLIYLVSFACRTMVEFLTIHPYVNGNGHMGRFIVWLILARFGYWPENWPLNTRPAYDSLIHQYRDGKIEPLEEFVLKCINGAP